MSAALIVDYQNVHLTRHDAFAQAHEARHETLIHPSMFAHQVLEERNSTQRDDSTKAVLRRVLVYRGLPVQDHDPKDYARSLAQ